MKIQIISSKDEIRSFENYEEMVHLSFRPSNKDIFNLINKSSNLRAIQIPNSFKKSISESTKILLEMQNIALIEGDVWSQRKHINEYYEVKPQVLDRINELKNEGKSKEEIISLLSIETHMSQDLIEFLV